MLNLKKIKLRMSSKTDRNPSPPPEILKNDEELLPDRIGTSVYSKQWLYKTLMSIVECCEDPSASKKKANDVSESKNLSESGKENEKNSGSSSKSTGVEMVELDSKIEEDACVLWDMTASEEVAEFLKECDAISIFLDNIEKTKSPRLLEIIIGILGNMSSFNTICIDISQNSGLVNTIISLTGTSDTPTLLQVFRVIRCGVSNKNTQSVWFANFEKKPLFMENMEFIFANSLNDQVIKAAFQLIHTILNEDIAYCKLWGQHSRAQAIIQAGKQLQNLHAKVDNFFCVICSLCQYTPNVDEIVESWADIEKLFTSFIIGLDDDEPLPPSSRIAPIVSCFDTYNTLLKSEKMKRELVHIDINALKATKKVSSAVSSLILDVKKDNMEILDLQNPQHRPPQQCLRRVEERNGTRYITMMSEYEYNTWNILQDTLMDAARTLLSYAEKENEKEILEDILKSEVLNESVGVLII